MRAVPPTRDGGVDDPGNASEQRGGRLRPAGVRDAVDVPEDVAVPRGELDAERPGVAGDRRQRDRPRVDVQAQLGGLVAVRRDHVGVADAVGGPQRPDQVGDAVVMVVVGIGEEDIEVELEVVSHDADPISEHLFIHTPANSVPTCLLYAAPLKGDTP